MKNLKILLPFFFIIGTIQFGVATEVKMAFGDKIPPFCFPETNSGIEVEVIGESLAFKGHILKPVYFPFARVVMAFKSGAVDATMTDLGENLEKSGGYYGDPAVIYDNVFITLKDRNLKITKPEDLKGLSVFSFQGAINRYPEWLKPVMAAGKYVESHDQHLQAGVLFRKRYDVILSDRNIFKYYVLQMLKEKSLIVKPIQEHAFVKLNIMDYRPVFKNKSIRDDFNLGLNHLKKTGRYQAIYDRYLKDPKVSNEVVLALKDTVPADLW